MTKNEKNTTATVDTTATKATASKSTASKAAKADKTTANAPKVAAPVTEVVPVTPTVPAEPKQETPKIISEVTTRLMGNIHEDLKEVSKRFVRIGVALYNFKSDRLYRELGYKTFEDFSKAEFGLSKASAYTFINVSLNYSLLTADGVPTTTLKKEFLGFSSSQLVEMLGLDEATLAKVKPTDTIRKIRDLKKSVQTSEQNPDSSESTSGSSKPKANTKDSIVPLNRLILGSVYHFDEIASHKKMIDRYCEEKGKTEGRTYRIELCVVWDDLTDTAVPSSVMNPPEDNTEDEDTEE